MIVLAIFSALKVCLPVDPELTSEALNSVDLMDGLAEREATFIGWGRAIPNDTSRIVVRCYYSI